MKAKTQPSSTSFTKVGITTLFSHPMPDKPQNEKNLKIRLTGTGTVVGTGIFWLYMCIGTGIYTGTGIGTGTYSVFQLSSKSTKCV